MFTLSLSKWCRIDNITSRVFCKVWKNTWAATEGSLRVAASLSVAAGVFPVGTRHQGAAAQCCTSLYLHHFSISGLRYFNICCSTTAWYSAVRGCQGCQELGVGCWIYGHIGPNRWGDLKGQVRGGEDEQNPCDVREGARTQYWLIALWAYQSIAVWQHLHWGHMQDQEEVKVSPTLPHQDPQPSFLVLYVNNHVFCEPWLHWCCPVLWTP